MNRAWRALAFPDVSESSLRTGLAEDGIDWEASLHVTATASLASAMRARGAPAIAIKDLTDLVIWSGMPDAYRMSPTTHPQLELVLGDRGNEFEAARARWSPELAGKTLKLGVRGDLRLRRYLDTQAPDRRQAALLRRSVRDVRRALQFMATAGVHPHDIETDDPLTRASIAAWIALESDVPELFRVREDMWFDPREFAAGTSEAAIDLRIRIDRVLGHLLSRPAGRGPTLIYHGFYFFSPSQWAWFQLLRKHDEAAQFFVVHDDGANRAFETWRRFFVERWDMPSPELRRLAFRPDAAHMLRDVLDGRRPAPTEDGRTPRIIGYRTASQFSRAWRHQRDLATAESRPGPRLFAADAKELERLVRRFGLDVSTGGADLSELPIGQFLLALHGCIEVTPPAGYRLTLTADRLIDMVSSGLLDSGVRGETSPSLHTAAIRRAMPFFDDRTTVAEWVERAAVLRRLLISEVSRLGVRDESDTDLERMASAASNPLRLAPWCDLSEVEAAALHFAVERIRVIAEQVVESEARDPEQYLGWIRRQLARGMQNLPVEVRQEIEGKLRGIGTIAEDDLDVEGVIDVVRMLLGRQAEFGLDGEGDDEAAYARELRSLDALAFRRSEADVHVANLADSTFPSRVAAVRWPFDPHCLQTSPKVHPVTTEIMRVREDTAPLSDLYLFWLALDGVESAATLTLSWIAEMRSEKRNPSALLGLITSVDHHSAAVQAAAGGIDLGDPEEMGTISGTRPLPVPRRPGGGLEEIAQAARRLHPIAAAASAACARRFAIQWALSESHSYEMAHQQVMLFGNLLGALARNKFWRFDDRDAERIMNDLWRHLTPGQRASSFHKRVVSAGGASWEWIYTLSGGSKRRDPLSEAYVSAKERRLQLPRTLAPDGGLLPNGTPSADVCNSCPVRPRCATARHD